MLVVERLGVRQQRDVEPVGLGRGEQVGARRVRVAEGDAGSRAVRRLQGGLTGRDRTGALGGGEVALRRPGVLSLREARQRHVGRVLVEELRCRRDHHEAIREGAQLRDPCRLEEEALVEQQDRRVGGVPGRALRLGEGVRGDHVHTLLAQHLRKRHPARRPRIVGRERVGIADARAEEGPRRRDHEETGDEEDPEPRAPEPLAHRRRDRAGVRRGHDATGLCVRADRRERSRAASSAY
nr:hypothetical protein [Naasia aerilata]